MSLDLAARPDEMTVRLREDRGFYAGACLMILSKDGTLQPLFFNAAQRIVHAKIEAQWAAEGRVRALILKARQEGISTYVCARFYHDCHLIPEITARVVADKQDRGADIFEMYERFHDYIPAEVAVPKRWAQRGLSLSLSHGSRIRVETAKDLKAGRGSTIRRLHCSEYAFWDHPEDVMLSLSQAVPDYGSEIIVESTANGVGNSFHRMWEAASEGRSGYIAVFLPWWIHEEYRVPVTSDEASDIRDSVDPVERAAQDEGFDYEGEHHVLTPEQLMWRRHTIADKCGGDVRLFQQEYPSDDEEAFLVSGNAFFDVDGLRAYRKAKRRPIARGNLLSTPVGIIFSEAERGYLRVWEWPTKDQPCPTCKGTGREHRDGIALEQHARCIRCKGSGRLGTRYVIGADTAEGRQVAARGSGASEDEAEGGGRDFNSASIFEAENPRLVARLHGRMAPDVFATDLDRVGRLYSGSAGMAALVGVERNHSSGQTVLAKLRALNYPWLFWHRRMNHRENKVTDVLGWVTDATTRMPMLDELAQAVREGTIGYHDEAGLREMATFVRGDDGKPQAQEGCHDDRVISDGIGLQMVRYSPTPARGELPEPVVTEDPTGW